MNISKSNRKYPIVSEIIYIRIIRWETSAQIISKCFTIKFQMKFVIWQWRMQVGSGCQIHFSEMKNLDLFTLFSSLTYTSEYSRMATYYTALGTLNKDILGKFSLCLEKTLGKKGNCSQKSFVSMSSIILRNIFISFIQQSEKTWRPCFGKLHFVLNSGCPLLLPVLCTWLFSH